MRYQGTRVRSLITRDRQLSLYLEEMELSEPGPEEVIVKVEAAPINPSDILVMFAAVNPGSFVYSENDQGPTITADVPEHSMQRLSGRLDKPITLGNEGAGLVVAAGSSDKAQALLGKTVGVLGGEMYAHYKLAHADQCLALNDGTTAVEGASCFVNPMTVLSMVDLMHQEKHKAIVHTAAASNLGQMLTKLCLQQEIDLINIVRKPAQEKILRDLGAKHVINSTSDSFKQELTQALIETEATLAFDAISGGTMASDILSCMERALVSKMPVYNNYGSDVYKQVYIYGLLDASPVQLNRTFGTAWGVSGFLLPHYLKRIGSARRRKLEKQVADGITSTFSSHFTAEVSLSQLLEAESVSRYIKQVTGEKYLLKPLP